MSHRARPQRVCPTYRTAVSSPQAVPPLPSIAKLLIRAVDLPVFSVRQHPHQACRILWWHAGRVGQACCREQLGTRTDFMCFDKGSYCPMVYVIFSPWIPPGELWSPPEAPWMTPTERWAFLPNASADATCRRCQKEVESMYEVRAGGDRVQDVAAGSCVMKLPDASMPYSHRAAKRFAAHAVVCTTRHDCFAATSCAPPFWLIAGCLWHRGEPAVNL